MKFSELKIYQEKGKKILALERSSWNGNKILYLVQNIPFPARNLRNEAKNIYDNYFKDYLKDSLASEKLLIQERYDLMSRIKDNNKYSISIECNYQLTEEDINADDWIVLELV